MRETILFLDQPAVDAIAAAARFLAAQPVTIMHQTPLSVAFAAPVESAPAVPRTRGAADSADYLQPGSAQLAAVPIQVQPGWCRLWLTVNGEGAAARAADAYIASQRERSRRVAAAVRDLERDIYDDSRWPAHESTLRATLARQGVHGAAADAKVAAFKQRWQTVARKARQAGPEEPEPA